MGRACAPDRPVEVSATFARPVSTEFPRRGRGDSSPRNIHVPGRGGVESRARTSQRRFRPRASDRRGVAATRPRGVSTSPAAAAPRFVGGISARPVDARAGAGDGDPGLRGVLRVPELLDGRGRVVRAARAHARRVGRRAAAVLRDARAPSGTRRPRRSCGLRDDDVPRRCSGLRDDDDAGMPPLALPLDRRRSSSAPRPNALGISTWHVAAGPRSRPDDRTKTIANGLRLSERRKNYRKRTSSLGAERRKK